MEEELRALSGEVSHSIVRPTAYFKSLDGQLESARQGKPVMFFGDGSCAANAICEKDLAAFLATCALAPATLQMLDATRDVGGPDAPPVTKRAQIALIYDALGVAEEKRKAVSIPVAVFDVLLALFSGLEGLTRAVDSLTASAPPPSEERGWDAADETRAEQLRQKCEDAAEIVRIVRYSAAQRRGAK